MCLCVSVCACTRVDTHTVHRYIRRYVHPYSMCHIGQPFFSASSLHIECYHTLDPRNVSSVYVYSMCAMYIQCALCKPTGNGNVRCIQTVFHHKLAGEKGEVSRDISGPRCR